jgi:hypothetical protein
VIYTIKAAPYIERKLRFINNDIDHLRAAVHWLIIDSATMIIPSPIVVIRRTTGRKIGVSATNGHDCCTYNSACDKCTTTTAAPVYIDVNTLVCAAPPSSTIDSSTPSPSSSSSSSPSLGLADSNEIRGIQGNPLDMKTKSKCKKA